MDNTIDTPPLENEMVPQQDLKKQEANEDFERALAKIKPSTKRKRPSYAFLEDAEKYSKILRQKMIEAAEKDIVSHENQQPCLEKFHMLPTVTEALLRKEMEEFLLDNGILDAIRIWLEPFDDGTLPSVDLKLSLLNSLSSLNIDTDHLRESGIGRIIMFMYKCPREIPEIKRKAGSLISKWCKPILRSGAMQRAAQAAQGRKLAKETDTDDSRIDLSRPHASIPKPALFDYSVRPTSKVNVTSLREQAKELRTSKYSEISGKIKKPSASKNITSTGMIKPSIEGRGLI